jgi:hypothetical protein
LGLGFNGVVKKILANVELKYDGANVCSHEQFPDVYFNNEQNPF